MSYTKEDINKLIDNWEDMLEAFYRLNVMYSAFPSLALGKQSTHDK